MNTVKQFIQERNANIKARFSDLKKEKLRDEALETVAKEFGLSIDSINTIVYRNNIKNRAN